MADFVILNTEGHNNTAISNGTDLYDLNYVFTKASAGFGQDFKKSSGFIGAPSEFEEANILGKNNTHVLSFNGINQALCMDHTSATTIFTDSLDISMWLNISGVPNIDSNINSPNITLFSTRADYNDSFLSSQMEVPDLLFVSHRRAGFNLGYKYTASTKRYNFIWQFGNSGVNVASTFIPGEWNHIKFKVVNKGGKFIIFFLVNGLSVGEKEFPPWIFLATSSSGKLIIGASLNSGRLDDGTAAVNYYVQMKIAQLSIFNGFDEFFDNDNKLSQKNFHPIEFFTKVPSTTVKATFETEAIDSANIQCITNHYAFSPSITQRTDVEPDNGFRLYDAQIYGKHNEVLGPLDPTTGTNVMEFDGKDDYLRLRNKSLLPTWTFLGGTRNRYFYDFNGSFTIQMWFRPHANFQTFLEKTYTYNNVGDATNKGFLGMSLFSIMPWSASDTTEITDINNIQSTNMVGLDFLFGAANSTLATVIPTIRIPGKDHEDISKFVGTAVSAMLFSSSGVWPWYHLAYVFDISRKNVILYITNHGNTVPDSTAQSDLYPSGYVLSETSATVSPQDFSQVKGFNKNVSDVIIGGRFYRDFNDVRDLFNGHICDIRIEKKALTLTEINNKRYDIVSP